MINLKTLSKSKVNILLLIGNLTLALLSLWFFSASNFDLQIQNNFFNFSEKKWLIDRSDPIKKLIFYQLPKIALGALILAVVVLCFFSFYKTKNKFFNKRYDILLIVIGLPLILLIAGNVKKITNIYCPNQLEIFGGNKPYLKILEHYPQDFKQEKKGQCFPAGHAITGFCLYIFCFIFHKKIQQIFVFSLVTIYGWILGFYQILKGAHFISDTLLAMLLCIFLAQIIAQIYRYKINKKFINELSL